MKVFEALADALAKEGVEVVFAMLDTVVVALAYGLSQRGIKVISARHEQAAVVMADGYARVTNRPGVCVIGTGPAIAQTGTGLLTARKHRSPILVIAGDLPSGTSHNVKSFDQRQFVQVTAGTFIPLASALTMAYDVRRAFRKVRSGVGPVVFDTPSHILAADFPGQWEYHPAAAAMLAYQREAPDANELDRAAAMLAVAKRPVILAGRGAVVSGAREEIDHLALRIDALVATTLQARSFFRGHPSDIGIMGGFATDAAVELLAQADCILVVGASLNPYTVGGDGHGRAGRLASKAKVIQIDRDSTQIGHFTPVDVAIVGDARTVVAVLNSRLDDVGIAHKQGFWSSEHLRPRIEAARQLPAPTAAGPSDPPHITQVVAALDPVLPKERTVVVDGGLFNKFVVDGISVPGPDSFVWSVDFGSIGLGLPMATGAALGRPDRHCILFVGDGGFMMSVGELDTAVRYRVPMTIVILNDGALGGEVRELKYKGLPPDVAIHKNPDFSAVAAGFGATGLSVNQLKDIQRIPKLIGEMSGPLVVDARITREERHRSMGEKPWL